MSGSGLATVQAFRPRTSSSSHMVNPVSRNQAQRNAYILFWTVVALVQGLLLSLTQDLPWQTVLVESVTYTVVFGFMGLVVWYVVRFSGLDAKSMGNALVSHAAAAAILIAIWLVVSYSLSNLILRKPLALRNLTKAELSWRAGVGLAYYLLVALYYYLLLFYQNYREKQLAELEMQSQLKESELSMLKAQLNPHFIFNSLNSISMLTLTRPEDAHEMIVKLSTFLRHTIGHSEADLVTLDKELETIALYLDIEKSRFGDRLSFEMTREDGIPTGVELPNLILQPLVENAIKYGVYDRSEGSVLHMRVGMEQDALVVRLTNACDADVPRKPGKGIGIQNVRARLQYHYEQPDLLQTRLEKGEEEHLFIATLKIPQNKPE